MLTDDAVALADRVRSAGGEITLHLWPEMMHVWHALGPGIPEAREAVAEVGEFLRARLT